MLWVGRCESVAVGWLLWIGRRGSIAVGWQLFVGHCRLVAVGRLLCLLITLCQAFIGRLL